MTRQIPIVDYLQLGEDPHLTTHECTGCGATYFDRRNACASCFGTSFRNARIPSTGIIRTYTIVAFAGPEVDVPFVAAVVDCDGTLVNANVVNVPADPDHVKLGMEVCLVTWSVGVDSNGTEAIGFAFEPMSDRRVGTR